MESQCEYCGYSDKQRCRTPQEAERCSRPNVHNGYLSSPLSSARPIKRLKRNVEVEWEWCQYMDDAELGLWTVRKIVKSDHAKFHSQGDALAFIEEMKKNGKS